MSNRRDFFRAAGAAAAIAATAVSRVGAATIPEAAFSDTTTLQPPPAPTSGRPFRPVVTLNGWSLPWRMNAGVKEFHLVAEPVLREFAPGMKAQLWGYNGSSPGPTIEAVEGDRVRIFVTNKLPEHTTVHWHGVLLPSGMDGIGGLTQPHIPPGKTFVYEFTLLRSGTQMYHPHADEMVQMAMGMMGMFIVHPKDVRQMKVDRDFAFLLASYAIEPGSRTPRTAEMTDFNLWTWNSRVFPGIDPLVARSGERVRIRVGNLTMTNHPIHMHGPSFEVTGTDGGWVRHCHKSHHTMNAMGHGVPNMIGVDTRGVAERIARLVPDYMAMGERGMAEMGAMEMPLPDNTLPMMTGTGPFGPMEMGGMFSVVKVRDDVAAGDYREPGPYAHPAGTVAYEFKGELPSARRDPAAAAAASTVSEGDGLRVRRPSGHRGH